FQHLSHTLLSSLSHPPHYSLPISTSFSMRRSASASRSGNRRASLHADERDVEQERRVRRNRAVTRVAVRERRRDDESSPSSHLQDRKSTRMNSSHQIKSFNFM